MGCFPSKIRKQPKRPNSINFLQLQDDEEEERIYFEEEDKKDIGMLSKTHIEVVTSLQHRPSDVTKVLESRWMDQHFSHQKHASRNKSIGRYMSKRKKRSIKKVFLRQPSLKVTTPSRHSSTLLPETEAFFSEEIQEHICIIHFNDVYEITERAKEPVGGAARFSQLIETRCKEVRERTGESPLILFSGDCLNPSILSCATKGRHMVDVFNHLEVDAAVFGNHDFDFGVDHALNCMSEMKSVWLIANVVDNLTLQNLAGGQSTHMITRKSGFKIGIVGLVEEEWLDTLSTVNKEDLMYTDYVEKGKALTKQLRHEGAKFIIALTHMRWPNDVRLANNVLDIDMILGGHDHDYDVKDVGECLIIKSGTNFRTLSEVDVYITNSGEVDVRLARHTITRNVPPDPIMSDIVSRYMNALEQSLDTCIGTIETDLNGKYEFMRTQETPLGNLVADIVAAATKADVVIINSGSFRSDGVHPKGDFHLNDLMTILPIADTVVMMLVSGIELIDAFENGVSKYPNLEGRFPQISGACFGFNPNAEPGNRIIWNTVRIQGRMINPRQSYHVATKAYIARGKDGYSCIAHCPLMTDPDASPLLSTIVRNHFSNVKQLKDFETNMRCKISISEDGRNVTCLPHSIDISQAFVTDATAPFANGEIEIPKRTSNVTIPSSITSRVTVSAKKAGHIPHFIAIDPGKTESVTTLGQKLNVLRQDVQNKDPDNAQLLKERAEDPTDIRWQVTPLIEARIFQCEHLY